MWPCVGRLHGSLRIITVEGFSLPNRLLLIKISDCYRLARVVADFTDTEGTVFPACQTADNFSVL